jgi:SAM-dependent methyltransferase
MHVLWYVVMSIVAAWAAVSGFVAVFIYLWIRERYGRGGPFPASQALSLVNPMRALLQPVAPAVRAFQLRPGDTVLEIGAGPGYFTVEAGRTVGAAGRIVCLDVQPGMIATLRGRLDARGVDNTRLLVGDAISLPLADHCVDRAFLVAVIGEIPDRPEALSELRRVMKPGGVLSIMETLTDCDYQLEDSVRDLCRATGFSVVDRQRRRLGYVMCFAAPTPGTAAAGRR